MTQVNKQTGLIGAIRGCSSWQDIQAKWRDFTEMQKGDLFEELVKAYLQLEPEYASKLRHVWLQREVPQAIARKLKLPTTDQGIDIVAETHDGEFWAIQCKYRQDTDHSLTWREISTFTGLTFGVCRGFAFGVICSTTERITHVLKDQDRIGFCALDVWQALDADFLKRLRGHLANKPGVLKPLKPRPHQKGAVKDGHEHFVIGKAKRGKLIMPCGSGKSLTAYWIATDLGARSIVIAVDAIKRKENEAVEILLNHSTNHHRANELRAFIEAARALYFRDHGPFPEENSPEDLWLKWAEQHAGILDPLGEGFRPWNGRAFRQISGLFPDS